MTPSTRQSDAQSAAWLRVDTPEAGYADSVVADLARIARTPSGRDVLEQIRSSGHSIMIEKPDPPTDPPNAWTRSPGAEQGARADIVIAYDPADWPSPHRPGDLPSDVVLFGRLQDALAMGTDVSPAEATAAPAFEAYLRERTAAGEPPPTVQR